MSLDKHIAYINLYINICSIHIFLIKHIFQHQYFDLRNESNYVHNKLLVKLLVKFLLNLKRALAYSPLNALK